MNKKSFSLLAIVLLFASCSHYNEPIDPKISYAITEHYVQNLPSPFPPLSEEEKRTGWGHEYTIGLAFADRLELYQAITAFKRARILLPKEELERQTEIEYNILLSYYFGQKYQEVIDTFQESSLRDVNNTFPPFKDLLLILYESYEAVGNQRGMYDMYQILSATDPEEGKKITLSAAMKLGDISTLEKIDPRPDYLNEILTTYNRESKSPRTAKALNALLPGTGYFYLGETHTGITCMLLNGLFIAASVISFQHDNIAAGAIFTGFELGWYFGGISGAGRNAKLYNERLYEQLTIPTMHKERLFPIFMLNYGF